MRSRARAALLRFGLDVRRVEGPQRTKRSGLGGRPRSANGQRDIAYAVGPFSLTLPPGHPLPTLRSRWRLFGEPQESIADGLRTLRGNICAIDVGANVGDSAALMNARGPMGVLCVEGDPLYLPYLAQNAIAIGAQVVVEECFVDGQEGFVDPARLDRHPGSTNAARALDHPASDGVPVRRLEEIVGRHPSFDRADFLKLHTDGRDFQIILSHEQFLTDRMPALFFQHLLADADDTRRSIRCLEMLLRIGYRRMLVFDNFGNPLLTTTEVETFEELNLYLLSNATYGTAVHYLDVCAIGERDLRLAEILREKTRNLVRTPPETGSG